VGAVPQTARTLELASNWRLNPGGGEFMPDTKDILTDALNVQSGCMKCYKGTGSSYTGSVPNSNYGYGTFFVLNRYSSSIWVMALSPVLADGIAVNHYTGTWSGWYKLYSLKSVTKTATLSYAGGTIGTRGAQVIWNSSAIGGNPIFTEITNISDSSVVHPLTFIYNNSVYVNAYRCTSGGVNQTVDVTIYYT
jgi:hypothetical protein